MARSVKWTENPTLNRNALAVSLGLLITSAHAATAHAQPEHGGKPSPAPFASTSDEITPAHMELLQTIQSMARAILSGDQESYLKNLDLTDPQFAQERKAWVGSLSDSPFADYRLWLQMPGRMTVTDTLAEVALHEQFALAKGDDLTKSVLYPARFVRKDGAWRFAGVKWETASIPGGTIRWSLQCEPLAKELIQRWPDLREKVHKALRHTPAEDYRTEFTVAPEGVRDWLPSDGESADPQGWYHNRTVHILQLENKPAEQAIAVMVHEYTHAMQEDMVRDITRSSMWIDEGLAQLIEHELLPKVDPVYAKYPGEVTQSTAVDWQRLTDAHHGGNLEMMIYSQGHSFIRFLDNTYGRERLVEWVKQVGTDGDVDRSARVAFGVSWDKLDQGWKRRLPP